MNNEPVAWMCPTGLEYKQRATDFMYNDALYDKKLNWIPLYTHPVKENAQYDKGFDAGVKHGKTIYEAEIEALKVNVKFWVSMAEKERVRADRNEQ